MLGTLITCHKAKKQEQHQQEVDSYVSYFFVRLEEFAEPFLCNRDTNLRTMLLGTLVMNGGSVAQFRKAYRANIYPQETVDQVRSTLQNDRKAWEKLGGGPNRDLDKLEALADYGRLYLLGSR